VSHTGNKTEWPASCFLERECAIALICFFFSSIIILCSTTLEWPRVLVCLDTYTPALWFDLQINPGELICIYCTLFIYEGFCVCISAVSVWCHSMCCHTAQSATKRIEENNISLNHRIIFITLMIFFGWTITYTHGIEMDEPLVLWLSPVINRVLIKKGLLINHT